MLLNSVSFGCPQRQNNVRMSKPSFGRAYVNYVPPLKVCYDDVENALKAMEKNTVNKQKPVVKELVNRWREQLKEQAQIMDNYFKSHMD
ncbi:hypothetical protein IJ732_07970 [bacterium]|nr:hypothetical protein [bacterium]